jgi:isopenicillin N synthase-like dioxygenase
VSRIPESTRAAPGALPEIAVRALFGGPGPARAVCDARLLEAASTAGFVVLTELPASIAPTAAVRAELKRVFAADASVRRRLWRRKFDPAHPNVYRGWFPVQDGAATYKEGIDLGPDVAHPEFATDPRDPLTEPTPLPAEPELPGWRAAVARYYLGMESLAQELTRALARGLGLDERWFDPVFAGGGLSTLRLIRYPERPAASFTGAPLAATWVEHAGGRRYTVGVAHADTGCLTLLAQDGVEGLQARSGDGRWVDVPPREGTVAMNFGALLARWTGGRICATEHRVLGVGRERYAMPFFFEPRVDALIAPLPLDGAPRFEPFVFGDYLWAEVTRFVEFRGLEAARGRRPAPVSATERPRR